MKTTSIPITPSTLADLRLCQRFLGCADLQATVEKLAGQRAWVIKKKENSKHRSRKKMMGACNRMHDKLNKEMDSRIARKESNEQQTP
jgi:hypothetical protein